MSNPSDLKYTKEHEWLKITSDNEATVGITDFAQNSLGDITYVDVPEAGDRFDSGESFGVVESVKAASDLYMPLNAEVLEVNDALESAPELVNQDPFGEGWIIKIRFTVPSQLESLLDSDAYDQVSKE